LYQYAAAIVMMPDDPGPAFYAAECLFALDHREEAREALEVAIALCTEDAHQSIKSRAQELMTRLVLMQSSASP
jgi:hypothetical protein